MSAATISTKLNMKPQVLKNESKGQLGKNWLVEIHEISVTTAGDVTSTKTLTSGIANPQFVSFCQIAGAAGYTEMPVVTITPATGSAAATVLLTFVVALTGTDKIMRVKIEGY